MSGSVDGAGSAGDADGGSDGPSWIDAELSGCRFQDRRLAERLRRLLHQLGEAIGAPLPLACQDWAATKAAYRFFDNARVSEAAILAGHFSATGRRFAACTGPMLVVQDTTEFSYTRVRPEAIGFRGLCPSRRGRDGRLKLHTVCGLLMHSSLVVTPDGLPLGLAAIKFWTRAKFKGTNELKRHVNPTRVPIEKKESIRWLENMRQATALLGTPDRLVHIGDRESDIYELFCEAQKLGTHFLVRTCVDRLAGDGRHTIAAEMAELPPQGEHRITIADADGETATATVELCWKRIHVLPPIGKQKRYPALDLTVIHARETTEPQGRPRIDWKLITDLPVRSADEAIEKLDWYARRWKIELYHKILKSGCRAETVRLRTAERLVNLIAVFCILAWRIFWLTMINRASADAPPRLALTAAEIDVLDLVVRDRHDAPAKTLAHYILKVARLGGYLARTRDPPPGNTVIWRGWSRLMDIMLGASLRSAGYG